MKFKKILINDNLKMHPRLAQLYRDHAPELPATGLPSCVNDESNISAFCAERPATPCREQITQEITTYLSSLAAPEESLKNAQLLQAENTFAIVSGHQPSLFGGPLFLILKICATIKTAKLLNATDPSKNYIPLFWNASEDHNTAEYLRTCFFDQAHDRQTSRLTDLPSSTGAEHLPATAINQFLDEIRPLLPQSEFLPQLVADLKDSAQGTIGQSFSRLMLKWFGHHGLVIIEPHVLRHVDSYRKIILQAVEKTDALIQQLDTASETIHAEGFTPQLPYGESEKTFLFYLADDNSRQRILRKDKKYYTTEGGLNLKTEDLLELIRQEPQKFSPVAALRPALQSAVLPVAAYICGGGELSYHFQLPGIFTELSAPLPPLLPRPSATVLKKAVTKYFAKSGFELADILSDNFSFNLIRQKGEENFREVLRSFWSILEAVEGTGRHLEHALIEAGIKNTNDWKKEKERFYERLEGLNRRYMDQNPAMGENAQASFNRMKKYLLPADGYQDNSCWFIYFYCLFGEELSDTICTEIEPFTNKHHVFIPEFDE